MRPWTPGLVSLSDVPPPALDEQGARECFHRLWDFFPETFEFDLRRGEQQFIMSSTAKDARDLYNAMRSAYAKTPARLKIIDVYIVYGLVTAFVQVVYMALVGTFPFNAFLSGVLSCIGTSVLGVCLRMQVNPANKDFKDLTPERAFADFVLCNLVLHLVIMNFLG